VVGNAAIGGLFLALLCRAAGNGVAWSLFLASGAIGNGINALIQDASHLSVGASTSVFGTLGALAVWQWSVDAGTRLRRTRRFAPIVMSVVLLTYLGAGGERTDVLAHVTGFLAGCGLSRLVAGRLARRDIGARTQFALLVGVVAVLAVSWTLALRG
jgi:membrane associated rhomboid family serine protease